MFTHMQRRSKHQKQRASYKWRKWGLFSMFFFSSSPTASFLITMRFRLFFLLSLLPCVYLLTNIFHITAQRKYGALGAASWPFSTCRDISMSPSSFLMPIQTRFPLSCWAMLARSLSVKLPSSWNTTNTTQSYLCCGTSYYFTVHHLFLFYKKRLTTGSST